MHGTQGQQAAALLGAGLHVLGKAQQVAQRRHHLATCRHVLLWRAVGKQREEAAHTAARLGGRQLVQDRRTRLAQRRGGRLSGGARGGAPPQLFHPGAQRGRVALAGREAPPQLGLGPGKGRRRSVERAARARLRCCRRRPGRRRRRAAGAAAWGLGAAARRGRQPGRQGECWALQQQHRRRGADVGGVDGAGLGVGGGVGGGDGDDLGVGAGVTGGKLQRSRGSRRGVGLHAHAAAGACGRLAAAAVAITARGGRGGSGGCRGLAHTSGAAAGRGILHVLAAHSAAAGGFGRAVGRAAGGARARQAPRDPLREGVGGRTRARGPRPRQDAYSRSTQGRRPPRCGGGAGGGGDGGGGLREGGRLARRRPGAVAGRAVWRLGVSQVEGLYGAGPGGAACWRAPEAASVGQGAPASGSAAGARAGPMSGGGGVGARGLQARALKLGCVCLAVWNGALPVIKLCVRAWGLRSKMHGRVCAVRHRPAAARRVRPGAPESQGMGDYPVCACAWVPCRPSPAPAAPLAVVRMGCGRRRRRRRKRAPSCGACCLANLAASEHC